MRIRMGDYRFRSCVQNGKNLLPPNRWKLAQEFVEGISALDVLEK